MEHRFGQTAQNMKANGKITKLMAKEHFGMSMGINMKAFSKMEKRIKSLEVKVGFLAKELKTLNTNIKDANKEKN